MKSTGEIGMKISATQREYYRYTGSSSELERKGAGSSRAALAWANRSKPEQTPSANESEAFVSPEPEIDGQAIQRATAGMRALRKRIGKLSLEEILSARDEGRA